MNITKLERTDLLIEAGLSVDDIKSFLQDEIHCWNVAVSYYNDGRKLTHFERRNLYLAIAIDHLEEKQRREQTDRNQKILGGLSVVTSLGFFAYKLFNYFRDMNNILEESNRELSAIYSIIKYGVDNH